MAPPADKSLKLVLPPPAPKGRSHFKEKPLRISVVVIVPTEKSVYLLIDVYEHEAEITYRPLKCEPGLPWWSSD